MSNQNLTPNTDFFKSLSFEELVSYALNLLALADRKLYLEQHPDDKGNGFYKRKLPSGSLTFNINVPRTRSGQFRPFFLPEKWQRHQKEDFVKLAYSVLLASRSVEAAKRSFRELSLPISENYLDEVVEEIREYFEVVNSSNLEPDLFALVVDAKVVKLKLKSSYVANYTTYVAVGISLTGKKQVLACFLTEGRETLDGWRNFLKSLIERGLRRVLVVVHDDFPGVSKLISSLFPQADDQLCTVHMLRNLKSELPAEAYRRFKEKLQSIKNVHSFELGCTIFEEACQELAKINPETAKRLMTKMDKYLAFLKYPIEVRPSISSTNLVESFNRQVEDAEQLSGGYFHSDEDFKLKLGIILKRLHQGKWKKPSPKIASVSHILMAKFKERFEND